MKRYLYAAHYLFLESEYKKERKKERDNMSIIACGKKTNPRRKTMHEGMQEESQKQTKQRGKRERRRREEDEQRKRKSNKRKGPTNETKRRDKPMTKNKGMKKMKEGRTERFERKKERGGQRLRSTDSEPIAFRNSACCCKSDFFKKGSGIDEEEACSVGVEGTNANGLLKLFFCEGVSERFGATACVRGGLRGFKE